MIDLKGKVVLITGASRGIGRSCAVEMARAGADVAINYHRHAEDAEAVAAQVRGLGREALVWQADVADRQAVEEMVAAVAQRLGHLDIVVCNAYYSKREPFLEIGMEGMRRTLEVSLWGAFHAAQLGARQMVLARGGRQYSLHQFGACLYPGAHCPGVQHRQSRHESHGGYHRRRAA